MRDIEKWSGSGVVAPRDDIGAKNNALYNLKSQREKVSTKINSEK